MKFEQADAGNCDEEPYLDSFGNHISHIYSYNKVMSKIDRANIAKKLNKTNFKLMTWYFGP